MPPALILLAAGGSTRMGRAKQLLPYRGMTLLRHAVNGALRSSCHPVVVVIGSGAPAMESELSGLPVRIANNPSWANGMGSSIRAGLAAVLAEVSPPAVVIMLCDQPAVDADVLDKLVNRHREALSTIIASEYNNAVGVPALFPAAFYDQLLNLGDSTGAREIISEHLDAVARVSFPAGQNDLDTPEQYELCEQGK